MGIKRSRAALAGGTMASVLGAAIGVALVLGAILSLVAFPAAPRPTGSPQPVVVLPADAAGRAEGAAARPRSVEIAAATRPVARRRPRAARAAQRGSRPVPVTAAPARRVAATPSTPVTAAAPRPTPAPAPAPAPSVVVAAPPASPAADAVQGAVDTATGVVTQARGALSPLPKPPAHAG